MLHFAMVDRWIQDRSPPLVRPGWLRPHSMLTAPSLALTGGKHAVYRKILRRRDFSWAEHGEALMRRRKAWCYQHEPRPGFSVIGDRLLELASGGRR